MSLLSFFAYTRQWMEKFNRGGLFPLNDSNFTFFTCIEKEVQTLLPRYMAKPAEVFKVSVVMEIMHDEDVKWNWMLLSQCIDMQWNY